MAAQKKPTFFLIVLAVASVAALLMRNYQPVPITEDSEFQSYPECTLVAHRNNDGDSFHARFPDGAVRELRLYYVDAPETAVKRYADGNTNVKRLGHQGDYFAGLSQDDTVAVGQEARAWVKGVLADQPFTVFTRGEEVFDSGRIFVLIRVERGGRERWLHELLVEEGLARIYTQGTDLPDGTRTTSQQLRRLHGLEKAAKEERRGAWGLASQPNRS